jgi:hypothetical protein
MDHVADEVFEGKLVAVDVLLATLMTELAG